MPTRTDIEVVYAETADNQYLVAIQFKPGMTIEQAIQASGLLAQCPDIDLTRNKVGVFGRAKQLTDAVKPGDRVEIYRPLHQNPMDARRQRALGR